MSSLFCVTDIFITDYSAIAIDWMVFNKPIIAYVPDFAKYVKKPSLTIDYMKEFPGPISKTSEELIAAIKKSDNSLFQEKRRIFYKKTYQYRDGKSTQRVVSAIHDIMGSRI